METFSLLEKLKGSIQRDHRVLEERCDKAQKKILCLEQENESTKEENVELQRQNASLKEDLTRLRKELTHKEEKLKRKSEEIHTRDRWWNRYRLMSEQRYAAMKDHGTFPAHILEKFVNRDIDEQMKDILEDHSPLKENVLHKKHKNLSTMKGRKRIRYDKLSNTKEKNERNSVLNCVNICPTRIAYDPSLVENDEQLFSDPNESTKLYSDFSGKQDSEKTSTTDESTVTPNNLETEDLLNRYERQGINGTNLNERSVFPKLDLEEGRCSSRLQDANGSNFKGGSVRQKPRMGDVRYSSQRQEAKVLSPKRTIFHQHILVPESETVPSSPNQEDVNVSVSSRASVCPGIVVPDTEDAFPDEAGMGFHSALGAPSATSTPVAAVDSPLFGFDNENAGDGILGGAIKSLGDDTVDFLTNAKTQSCNLPKSDSQLPVDLSCTQPQSPTIPSRTRSLQKDFDLSADCSVSLLPHGKENDFVNADLKKGKQSEDEVFEGNAVDELKSHLKRVEESKNPRKKVSKQTTLDSKLLKVKENQGNKEANVSKRKRESSIDIDDFVWPNKGNEELQSETIFKVPELPLPKTPEVILLDEFPPQLTRRKSCSTPVSGGEDMDQSADLFGNMNDVRSPDKQGDKRKEISLEKTEKETVPNKNLVNKPSYKYVEVVRKKEERAKLNGYDCRECQQYYEGLDLPEEELKKRLKQCSRHRARFSPPPSTPPGFWNLSFPNTQEYIDKGYLKTESQAPAPKRLRRTRRNRIVK